MSEESTDQASPLQFLRKPHSKISWKVFPGTQRARKWLEKTNLPRKTWKKVSPFSGAWMCPGLQQQEHGQSSDRTAALVGPWLEFHVWLWSTSWETLASWTWSKGGQSAAEPAMVEGTGFVQPRENPTQTFQHLQGAQRGDGTETGTSWPEEIPLRNKKQKV